MEEKREKERERTESGERDPLGLGSTSLVRESEDSVVYGNIARERGCRGGRGRGIF